jgi:hypothetical protein
MYEYNKAFKKTGTMTRRGKATLGYYSGVDKNIIKRFFLKDGETL